MRGDWSSPCELVRRRCGVQRTSRHIGRGLHARVALLALIGLAACGRDFSPRRRPPSR